MRNEDDRDLLLRGEKQDFVLQSLPSQRIERTERLVHQQNFGRLREATRDLHPLLHAAGKLRGILIGGMREADALEQSRR